MESREEGVVTWSNLIARLRRSSHSSASSAGKTTVGAIAGAHTGSASPDDASPDDASPDDVVAVSGPETLEGPAAAGATTSGIAGLTSAPRRNRPTITRENRANLENTCFASPEAMVSGCSAAEGGEIDASEAADPSGRSAREGTISAPSGPASARCGSTSLCERSRCSTSPQTKHLNV